LAYGGGKEGNEIRMRARNQKITFVVGRACFHGRRIQRKIQSVKVHNFINVVVDDAGVFKVVWVFAAVSFKAVQT
jgi:hypothetical protein